MKQRFFDIARKISYESTYSYRLGSCIVRGGNILGVGYNELKHSAYTLNPYYTTHAEAAAILSTRSNLKGSDLYVYRATRDGIIKKSKPCVHCMKLIRMRGIKRVYYTDEDGYKCLKV